MCLYVTKKGNQRLRRIRTEKKPVTVYKVVIEMGDSTYLTPTYGAKVRMGKVNHPKRKVAWRVPASGWPDDKVFEGGVIHAFLWLETAQSYMYSEDRRIFKIKVPWQDVVGVGSTYGLKNVATCVALRRLAYPASRD